MFAALFETAGCVKLGGGVSCFCENISYSFILLSLLCGIAGEGAIVTDNRKEQAQKNFLLFRYKGPVCVSVVCVCKKNSDNLLWYYKPTLNKTLFFLPFFFLSVLDEEESSVLESLPSSLLAPPHALLTCCPDAVLRIFKII